MTQLKFYKYATYGLVLLNLAMLTFFFITKGHHKHGKPNMKAIETLKLDEAQHTLFLTSAQKHSQIIQPLNEKKQALLQDYFYDLLDATTEIHETDILHEVEVLERHKIEATYQHFKEIKTILRKEQYPDFESFMKRMVNKILPRSKKLPTPMND